MKGTIPARARRTLVLTAGLLMGFICGNVIAQAASKAPSPVASFQAWADRATAARDADRLDEALPLYRKALALNPKWVEGWWSLGTVYYDTDRYAEAALAFQRVVALDPRHGTAHAMLGLCEAELGQDDAALRDLEASDALGIADDRALRQVVLLREGGLMQQAGRFEGAEHALSGLCIIGVRSPQGIEIFGLAVLHRRDKQLPAPGSEDAAIVNAMGRGACLGAQKSYERARQEYELVAARYPQYPYVHYAMGRLRQAALDPTGAVTEFQKEIEIAPGNILARLQIAASQYKVDSSAGLKYAEEAVRLAPKLPVAHYLFGLLLNDTGAYEKAIPELEIAVKAFPRDAKIDLALGSAYAHVGRAEDAARARAAFLRLSQAEKESAASAAGQNTGAAATPLDMKDAMDAAPQQ